MPDDTDNLLRLRNNLRSLLGLSVAGGTDDVILTRLREWINSSAAVCADLRMVTKQRDDCREQIGVSERRRKATIADREDALNERDEARATIKECFACAPIDTATAIEYDGNTPLYLRNTIDALRAERDTARNELGIAERGRTLGLVAINEQREEIEGLRELVRELTTSGQAPDARDPSDELAALRRQVAELSFGASSWHKAHATGYRAADDEHDRRQRATVVLLLDGLETVCIDELERSTVRAIRAALGMDAS